MTHASERFASDFAVSCIFGIFSKDSFWLLLAFAVPKEHKNGGLAPAVCRDAAVGANATEKLLITPTEI